MKMLAALYMEKGFIRFVTSHITQTHGVVMQFLSP